ncbi:hypothetical protein Ccrd_026201, partial [Cynara cardunculus var. scolymus]
VHSVAKSNLSETCKELPSRCEQRVGNTLRRHYETNHLAHADVDGEHCLLCHIRRFGKTVRYVGNGRISVVTEDRVLVLLRLCMTKISLACRAQ